MTEENETVEKKGINLDVGILDRKGKPVLDFMLDKWWEALSSAAKIQVYEKYADAKYDPDDGDELKVGEVAARALIQSGGDDKADINEIRRRTKLQKKIDKGMKNGGSVVLSSKQKTLIVDRVIAAKYGHTIVDTVYETVEEIDPDGEDEDDE